MEQQLKKDLAAYIKNALQVADALGLTKVGIALNTALVELDGVGEPPADETIACDTTSTAKPAEEMSHIGKLS